MLKNLLSTVKKEKSTGQKPQTQAEQQEKTYNEHLKHKQNFLTNRTKSYDDLSQYKIEGIESVYYIPNYITQDDHNYLWAECMTQTNQRWNSLSYAKRRVARWGGEVTDKGLLGYEPLPDWLEKISQTLDNENITEKKTNHVLINEYEPGTGIMPHTDGPLYHPYVTILSLGSPTCFHFFKNYQSYKDNEPLKVLLVEPKSLLIFTDEAYHDLLHSIIDQHKDNVSLIVSKKDGDSTNEGYSLLKSSIANMGSTDYLKNFISKLNNSPHDESEISHSESLQRTKRVSLTIRFVPRKKLLEDTEAEAQEKQDKQEQQE